jgi:transcriptional regulator with XRE-family HTH domain
MSTKGVPPSTPKQRRDALAKANITAADVLNALQIELGLETDQELAKLAGVSKATVSTWRSRNSIPYELVVFLSLQGLVDLNYVLTHRGRLSGFLDPSESLDDPDLVRTVEELALAETVPIKNEPADIERAAADLIRRRKTLLEFVKKSHRNWQLRGPYIPFIVDVLKARKEDILTGTNGPLPSEKKSEG